MSQAKNPLEEYVANQLRSKLDPRARRTRASGASTELGDILSKHFYVECKQRTKPNAIIDRSVFLKLLSQRANFNKWCILVLENATKDRYVVMDAEEFFQFAQKALRD